MHFFANRRSTLELGLTIGNLSGVEMQIVWTSFDGNRQAISFRLLKKGYRETIGKMNNMNWAAGLFAHVDQQRNCVRFPLRRTSGEIIGVLSCDFRPRRWGVCQFGMR